MRRKKKIELVEALATLCRDIGYKKATADSFNEKDFIDKVVELLNHTNEPELVDEIHQRFYQVLAENKKISSLLMNDKFKETFNDCIKGLSKYKKVKGEDAKGSVHINNYFGLDTDSFFLHAGGDGKEITTTSVSHHLINSKGDPYFIHNKKAILYDDNHNRLLKVICKDGAFIFKHNSLPYAVEFNPNNGLICAMSHEYHDSLESFDDIEFEKCLMVAFVDLVSEDTSFAYAFIVNIQDGNEHLGSFFYVVMAAMTAMAITFGKTKKSHTILSLLLLNMILKRA